MKKKLLSAALAVLLLLSLSAPAFAAELTDLPESKWYYSEVTEMVAGGYISGYPDGSFRGEASMTVAEFVTILAKLSGVTCGAQDGHWAGMQLAAAMHLGWLEEADLALAGRDDPVPRQIAARLLVQALDTPAAQLSPSQLPFCDLERIGARYLDSVAAAYASGLFQGDTDGNFSPDGSVTRGAAAVLLCRAIHLEETAGVIPHPGYTKEQVKAHFLDCALGAEYGDATPVVKKWGSPI